MTAYPNQTLSFTRIVLKSMRHHPRAIKQTILLIVLMAVVKDTFIYAGGLPENTFFRVTLVILITAVLMYLWSVMLYLTSELFSANETSLMSAIRRVNHRVLAIYGCCALYVGGAAAIIAVAVFLLHLVERYNPSLPVLLKTFWVLLVGGMPALVYLILSLFALPIIIMEEVSVLSAFNKSMHLVKHRWFGVFGVYMILLVIVILTSPNTLHAAWLRSRHLELLFDLVVLCIMLPIFTNAVLLMLHDTKLQALG